MKTPRSVPPVVGAPRRVFPRLAPLLMALSLVGCDALGTPTEAEHRERAERHMEAGEYAAATIEYRNALQHNPDPEIRGRLGLAYLRDQHPEPAVRHLQRALETGADPNVYALPLARLLFMLGGSGAIAEIPEADALEGEDAARLLAYRSLAAFQAGEASAGSDYLAAAREVRDDLVEIQLARAYQAMSDGDAGQAMKMTDAALETDSEFAPAWSLKGDLERVQGDPEAALKAFGRAVELRPDAIAERLKRGLIHVELAQFDEARADGKFLQEGAPNHPGGHFLLGLIEFETGEPQQARPHLEEALAASPNYRLAMPYLAAIQLEEGNWSQAERLLERHHALGPASAMSYRLLAQLRIEQGRTQEARRILAEALSERPGLIEALGDQLAALYIGEGDTESGIEVLREALSNRADRPELQEMLGIALVRHGDHEQGMALLQRVAMESTDVRLADYSVALAHIRDGQYEQALEATQRLRDKDPENPQGYNLMGAALLGLGETHEARLIYQEGLSLHPDNSTLALNLSSLEVRQGNLETAREILEDLQDRDPGHPTSAIRLATLHFQQGEMDAGKRWLQGAIEAHPDRIEPYLMLARAQNQQEDHAAARSTLEKAREHHPNDTRVLGLLVDLQEREGDFAGAAQTLAHLAVLRPDAAELRFRQARNLAALGETEQAVTALRETLSIDSSHMSARMVLTRHLSLAGEVDEARQVFEPVMERAPEAAQVIAQQAWFDAQAGELDKAIEGYGRALERETRRDWLVEKYQVQQRAGHSDAALETLHGWLQEHPQDTASRHLLGSAQINAGHEAEALETYQTLLEQRPNDVIALNNAAWLARETDNPRAREYAQRAAELAPDQPAILDTLGVVLLEGGDTESALETLQRAYRMSPQAPDIGFHLAQAYQASGDTEQARALLTELLEAHEDFPERERAQSLRESL